MAITSEAGTLLQEITFATATTPVVVSAATALNLSPGSNAPTGDTALGDQYITVHATMTVNAATATLIFFKADDDSVGTLGAGKFSLDSAAVAATAHRQSHSTAAGDYVATVTFNLSGKNTLDLGRFGKTWPKWYCACSVLSSGSITVRIERGRAV